MEERVAYTVRKNFTQTAEVLVGIVDGTWYYKPRNKPGYPWTAIEEGSYLDTKLGSGGWYVGYPAADPETGEKLEVVA